MAKQILLIEYSLGNTDIAGQIRNIVLCMGAFNSKEHFNNFKKVQEYQHRTIVKVYSEKWIDRPDWYTL